MTNITALFLGGNSNGKMLLLPDPPPVSYRFTELDATTRIYDYGANGRMMPCPVEVYKNTYTARGGCVVYQYSHTECL